VLYVLLFNLGLIAFLTPVTSEPLVRQLDWSFLVVGTLTATAFLWRGRVGRSAGQLLLVASALFIVLHDIADALAQSGTLTPGCILRAYFMLLGVVNR
jgi:Ca2+/Na+ antiporter